MSRQVVGVTAQPAEIDDPGDARPSRGVGEGVGRRHLSRGHAQEFGRVGASAERVDIGDSRERGAFVALCLSKLQQCVGAAEPVGQRTDAVDELVGRRAFLAELLRTLGVVPDLGIFEFSAYFLETLGFRLVVKDTP